MKYQSNDITAESIDYETVPETSSFRDDDLWNERLQMSDRCEVHERVIGMSVLEVIY